MPIHDWTRVEAGIFHDFHHEWISTIRNALNGGILPPDHYALAEQISGGFGPDVITLDFAPTSKSAWRAKPDDGDSNRGIALAEAEPKVSLRAKTEDDIYAAKANRIAVRHVSDHRLVAMIEIVSPGNKSSLASIRTFAEKAADLIQAGIHLMVIDIFPPGPRDPQGIHKVIWDEFSEEKFNLPADKPLTMASHLAGPPKEAFVEFAAVGQSLPKMPLFLSADIYVNVPLEATYQTAWRAVPAVWKAALDQA
jgi:hypothetical protein